MRTTPYSRLLMARRVGAGERVADVAADFWVSQQVHRWCRDGEIVVRDRSSRPGRLRGTAADNNSNI